MRNRQEADREWPGAHRLGPARNRSDPVGRQAAILELLPGDVRGKGAGVDRRRQGLGEMADGADVILMRMGYEDRIEPVGTRDQPGHVGKDQVDPGRPVHVGKGHAQIDQDQPLAIRRAIAEDIGIHADFPGPAERQVDQALAGHMLPFSLL